MSHPTRFWSFRKQSSRQQITFLLTRSLKHSADTDNTKKHRKIKQPNNPIQLNTINTKANPELVDSYNTRSGTRWPPIYSVDPGHHAGLFPVQSLSRHRDIHKQ